MPATYASAGSTGIWRTMTGMVRNMILSSGFLLFLTAGMAAALFMPPLKRAK